MAITPDNNYFFIRTRVQSFGKESDTNCKLSLFNEYSFSDIIVIKNYEEPSQYLNWFIFSDHVVPPPSINPNLSSQRCTKAFLLTQIFPISYPSVLLTRSSHGYFVSRNKSSISSGPCCNILDGTLFTAFCACRFDSTLQVSI